MKTRCNYSPVYLSRNHCRRSKQCAAQLRERSHSRSGDDEDSTEAGDDDNDDASSTCSSAPARCPPRNRCVLQTVWLRLTTRDTCDRSNHSRKERANQCGQRSELVGHRRGQRADVHVQPVHAERIHLKLVEMPTFTDLFNPDLPYACCDLLSTPQLWSLLSLLLTLMPVVALSCSFCQRAVYSWCACLSRSDSVLGSLYPATGGARRCCRCTSEHGDSKGCVS